MNDRECAGQIGLAWNRISDSYQDETEISTDDVHYGPWAPGEREMGLLGNVSGKDVVEIGCGGGQNVIALSRWGARCVGVDPSIAQLRHAQRLAQTCGVSVRWVLGTAERLALQRRTFDLALSSYAFDYVPELDRAYREAWRVLRPQGQFVFCLSHPWFQAVGWHLAGDPEAPQISDYAAWPVMEEWDWAFDDGSSACLRSLSRTLASIINSLLAAGFRLERMEEQPVAAIEDLRPEELARMPYRNRIDCRSAEYAVMRRLPRTLLLCARKEMTA